MKDDSIARYLKEALVLMRAATEDTENPFSKISITKYLPTVREAKKYLNLLKTDYTLMKERIDKYLFCMGDFCLLELLKYRYSAVYFELRANPEKFLSYENTGWNSPVGLPKGNAFGEDDDLLTLMRAVFRKVDVFDDPEGVVGVANQDFFQLYFDGRLAEHYVEGNEFMESLKAKTLPEKMGEWVDEDRSGMYGLLCVAQAYVSKREMFLALAEYVWHRCEKSESMNTLGKMAYGYDKEGYKHSYKNIKELISEIPQMHLLAFQHLPNPDELETKENNLEKLINESNRTLENLGIWLNELRCTDNKDYLYDEIRHYVELLWKKLVSELADDALSTLNVIDIWADSTSEDTFESMILPLVIAHPQRWLGAAITSLHDDGKEYYLLKSRGIHAIFGSHARMNNILPQIVGGARDEDKDYVVAFANLVYKLDALLAKKETPTVANRRKALMEGLETEQLPALADGIMTGLDLFMPMAAALRQLKDTPFWRGDDLRIRRESPRFYFGTEI